MSIAKFDNFSKNAIIFNKGGKMKVIVKKIKKLVIDKRSREWCRLPYSDHPRGCPNYGKCEKCPPRYPLMHKILDLKKPIYIVAVRFHLDKHVRRMKKLHPKWTKRQCRCLLYWQGTVNKKLRQEVKKILTENKLGDTAEFGPEAGGVNVTLTCARSGINLEWPPKKYVHKLAFIGFKK